MCMCIVEVNIHGKSFPQCGKGCHTVYLIIYLSSLEHIPHALCNIVQSSSILAYTPSLMT